MFKKILIGVGVVVLLIVLGIGAMVGWVFHARSAYAATAVPYIKMVVPKFATWDPAQVKLYMDPAAMKGVPDDKLQKLQAWLSTLGHLKSMDEPVFVNVWSGAYTGVGTLKLVTYTVHAHFDAGDGNITIRLRDNDGKFTVYGFFVNSDALMTQPKPKKTQGIEGRS